MTRTSVLNDCLNAINNAEKQGKRQVMIRPSSKVIVKFLSVMQKHGMSPTYISFMQKEQKELERHRCDCVVCCTTLHDYTQSRACVWQESQNYNTTTSYALNVPGRATRRRTYTLPLLSLLPGVYVYFFETSTDVLSS